MEPIDIVINHFRRLHYLKRLVGAIRDRTEYPHRVIVVDNCSIPETRKFINSLKEDGLIDEVIFNEINYPLPQSLKQGIKLVKSEYCITTTEDVIPPISSPCWLTHLNNLIRNNQEYGAISFRYQKRRNGDVNDTLINVPLDNNIEECRTIEEFLKIQRTSDTRKIGFDHRHVADRHFGKIMRKNGKKIGRTVESFPLRSIIWRDKNLGYEDNLLERNNFINIEAIDIIILTCNRVKFLKETIENIENRINIPFRLIIVNNNSKDGTNEYLDELRKNRKYISRIINNKDGEERGLCAAFTQGLKFVRSKYFITTHDDIVVPDLEPDVLVRLMRIMDKNEDCGAICLRTAGMRRHPKDDKEIFPTTGACPPYFRIQRKLDMLEIGGFGKANHYDDIEMTRIINNFGKYTAIASDLWGRNLGHAGDRGYPQWYIDQMKGNRKFEWIGKRRREHVLPELDKLTNKPLI